MVEISPGLAAADDAVAGGDCGFKVFPPGLNMKQSVWLTAVISYKNHSVEERGFFIGMALPAEG